MGEPGRRVLNDRYELDELIASGGMGQVWRGRDTRLGRSVAVKLLRSEYTGDPTFLARFRAEAHHAAALSHPNIAAVYDYGEATDVDGEHLAYLVMELVQGEALSTRLEEDGPLSPEATLSVLRQTAAALAEAHHVGLVHRDVKPGNILLEPSGRVKITDFGIAWSAGSVPLTEVGKVLGSPQYLPPELAVGDLPSPASDVYSLGLVGYECLTGQPAFDGENPVTIALKQVQEQPEPLPDDLPPGLRELVDVAVAKDPGERIPDGDAFVAAVDRVRAGQPIDAGHDIPATTNAMPLARLLPPPRSCQDSDRHPPVASRRRVRRVLPAVAALLAVVAGLAVVLGLTRGGGTLPEAVGTSTSQSAGIVLTADDYVGRPAEDVTAELAGFGLAVEQVLGAGVGAAPGTVTQVDPVGRELQAGDVATVFVAGEEQQEPGGPASVAPVGVPSDGASGGELGAGVGSAARGGAAAGAVPGTASRGTTENGATENGTPGTAATEPSATGTGTETGTETGTDTGTSEPSPTESASTGTAPTESAPTETAPTESAPTETDPTETAPEESAPTESAPTETVPAETADDSAAPVTSPPGTSSSEVATPPSDSGTTTG